MGFSGSGGLTLSGFVGLLDKLITHEHYIGTAVKFSRVFKG